MISIDALRPDRMSLHGYGRPTTPTFERLAASGAHCTESISTTAFTQPALPSMLTSSLPLSYGGYDQGAVGRPPTLFKVMGDNSYRTTLLSTFPWVNRFYGYSNGVQAENLLFTLNALVGVASQTMASIVRAYNENEITQGDMLDAVRPVLLKLYEDLESYCDYRLSQRRHDLVDLSNERLLTDGYDYPRVKKIITRHRADFINNPAKYTARYLSEVPNSQNWIAQDWRLARRPRTVCRLMFQRLAAAIMGPLSPSAARLMEFPNKRYVDAQALANRVIRTIDSQDPDHPFFIWTHFFDTHVPYCPGAGTSWKHNARQHLDALGYRNDIDLSVAVKKRPETEEEWSAWRALYDASAHYVDSQVARILDTLRARGLDDNTLVVITSDHGEELGEHGDVSHHFRLYEHNLRIPMIFKGPDVERRDISALTTIMDISPSIADIAGVDSPPAWEGSSVFSSEIDGRDHALAEAFHSGNCLFDHRPPYIAVRTREYKYLWKEYRDVTDRYSSTEPELYRYRDDPDEQNDLYRPDHPEVAKLNGIVARRLAEIPEISDARIRNAFNAVGNAAIAEVRGSQPVAPAQDAE